MIPKKFHYIWLGPYSDTLNNYREWRTIMPSWDLYVWDNNNLNLYLTELIDTFTWETIRHKYFTYISDVLRLMILRDYGGVYMDHDMIVCRDFDDLVSDLDFFTTYQFAHQSQSEVPWQNSDPSSVSNTDHEIVQSQLVNPCILGASQTSDIPEQSLKLILHQETLSESERYPLSTWVTGPQAMTEVLRSRLPDLPHLMTTEVDGVKVFHKDVFHPVHMMYRVRHGESEHLSQIEAIKSSNTSYTIHYHHNVGLDTAQQSTGTPELKIKPGLMTFGKWYVNR